MKKQKSKLIISSFLILAILITVVSSYNVFALSKEGSRGDEVVSIQKSLSTKGYYKGDIDGIFGVNTKRAVIEFQKDNDLVADGVVGTLTKKALGLPENASQGQFTSSEMALLANVVSAESRGEPYEGQVAVAAVILNRIAHPSFPNTLSGVLYQPNAFTCMKDGQIDKPVVESAHKAVVDAINGWDPSGGAVYYFNPETARSDFLFTLEVINVIGNHNFCI